MIYFDNAATTLQKPEAVPRAVTHAITHFGAVGRGVHEASIAAGLAVYQAREQITSLFGAPSARLVAFCANATEALNIAISGLLQPGDHAITSAASHNSVLRPLYRAQEQGCVLSIAPISPDGSLDYDVFESLFTPSTRLAVMTHASNVTGDIYDIARLAKICHDHNALLVVDAAQTAGLIPIDMQADDLDIVAFTGHKSLYGPQGTGGLCLREGIEISPFFVGGSGTRSFSPHHPTIMPEALEAGTLNSHGIAGLSAGLDYVTEVGIENIHAQTLELADRFTQGIRAIDRIRLFGGQTGAARCGIVALNVEGIDSGHICDRLNAQYQIMTRSGIHCAPLMHEAIGTADSGIVRFSFSSFNTTDEIDQGIQALSDIVQSEPC